MKRALYIGRFQVFHLGHLDVIQTIDAAGDIDEIILAIGSAQYDHRTRSPVAPWAHNPFSVEERQEMIERSLKGLELKPLSMHPVPDYHDWIKWHQHLLDFLPPFQCLYSADPREREFFADHGVETREFPRRYSFHAGSIRRQIADGEDFGACVPRGTLEVLERIEARPRLVELFARDLNESQE